MFHSPYLQAHFDVGNIANSASQDWILTLGPRIKRLHVKDWFAPRRAGCVDLGEAIDWPAVRPALVKSHTTASFARKLAAIRTIPTDQQDLSRPDKILSLCEATVAEI